MLCKCCANLKKQKSNILIINMLDFLLSGLLDSNQRPRAPQTCALPTALNPELFLQKRCKGTEFF